MAERAPAEFEPLLAPKEAAACIGVSEDTLRALVRAGEVRFINVGTGKRKVHRFAPGDLRAYQFRTTPKLMQDYAEAEGLPWPIPEAPAKIKASGLIYVVGHGRYVKIGYATDLARRMTELRVSTPQDLKLYASFPGTRVEERALHNRFASARVRGEWFIKTPEIKDWIAGKVVE